MQRVDLIPLVLLGALAGVVGFRMVREPHVAPAAIILKPVAAKTPPPVSQPRPVAAPAVADTTPKMQALPGLIEEPAVFVPGPRSD